MTTYRWSLLEDVIGCRQAGIPAIGLWRPKLAEYGEERSVEILRESDLAVSSLSWIGGFTGTNGLAFDEACDDAREAIRLAGEVEAKTVVVSTGPRNGHIRKHARRLAVDALTALADLAADNDTSLAVCPMNADAASHWTFLNSLEDTVDVIDACRHPAVQIAFDAFHHWQEPDLYGWIRAFAPRVAVVQLGDAERPNCLLNDRCLRGDGKIPLYRIVGAFLDAGYTGHFEINVWSSALWRSNYADVLRLCTSRFTPLTRRATQPVS